MKRTFALLAGGQATRLNGIEKLNLELKGTRIIEMILSRFFESSFFDEFVVLVGSKSPDVFLPLSVERVEFIEDIFPQAGPLGGLYSLFERHDADAVFLLGGDMPFADPNLAIYLYRYVEQGYDVVVPEGEPLAGWYHSRVFPAVKKALEAGKRRVISFFDSVNVKQVGSDEIKNIVDLERCFFNINTQEDYEKAVRISQESL